MCGCSMRCSDCVIASYYGGRHVTMESTVGGGVHSLSASQESGQATDERGALGALGALGATNSHAIHPSNDVYICSTRQVCPSLAPRFV